MTVHDVVIRDVNASGLEAGSIEYAEDWEMDDVVLRTPTGEPVRITNSSEVEAPRVERDATIPLAAPRQ